MTKKSEWRTLTDELAALEETNPEVAKAAHRVELAVTRALGCKHLVACKPGRCDGVYATDFRRDR